ncbi:hypothetical protein Tco_0566092 [Tanacetum coccineum]
MVNISPLSDYFPQHLQKWVLGLSLPEVFPVKDGQIVDLMSSVYPALLPEINDSVTRRRNIYEAGECLEESWYYQEVMISERWGSFESFGIEKDQLLVSSAQLGFEQQLGHSKGP